LGVGGLAMLDNLCKAGVRQMLPDMGRIDAIRCADFFQKKYGERIDWHEFAGYLDTLRMQGVLEVVRSNHGMLEYRIKER